MGMGGMIMKKILKEFSLKGLTIGQKLIVWWGAMSLVLLGCTFDAPLWIFALELINFAAASWATRRYVPMGFDDWYIDEEEDEDGDEQ